MSAPCRYTGAASADLVAAAQSGDRDAFAALWLRYSPAITAYVARRLRGYALVEDLTSETFLRAWRSIGSYRDQGRDVGAWLSTIAGNLVRDHVKSHRVQRETTVADVTVLSPAVDPGPGVEQTVLAQLELDALGRKVAGLTVDQRAVLGQRFGLDMTVAEVAEEMGRSVSAVKALQHRATTHLGSAVAA